MTENRIPHVALGKSTYPLRQGNKVIPWVDGKPFYTRLYEAFEKAEHSIWFVVSFLHRDFQFPQGPYLWDALDEFAAKGIDVRVLFWRNPHFFQTSNLFLGTSEDIEFLRSRATRWKARWDSSGEDAQHCHHQKFWMCDAGRESAVGFVGGMTFGKTTVDNKAHRKPFSRHDICMEVHGPCLQDLHHTFVERWNEAGTDPHSPLPWPNASVASTLSYHDEAFPPSQKGIPAQLTRSLKPGLYTSAPQGEDSIWLQYQYAFQNAQRSIYIENQHPGEKKLLCLIEDALQRGVQVVYIVPGTPMKAIYDEKEKCIQYQLLEEPEKSAKPKYYETFAALQRLATYQNFTFMALAKNVHEGRSLRYEEIYTHAKLCIVDAEWLTCGSANLVDLSFHKNHTELNVSCWDPDTSRGLLLDLLLEHSHIERSEWLKRYGEDERNWLQAISQKAKNNSYKRTQNLPLEGHCYALSSASYPTRDTLG